MPHARDPHAARRSTSNLDQVLRVSSDSPHSRDSPCLSTECVCAQQGVGDHLLVTLQYLGKRIVLPCDGGERGQLNGQIDARPILLAPWMNLDIDYPYLSSTVIVTAPVLSSSWRS